jgi:mono/diheme cytochrome c family protein
MDPRKSLRVALCSTALAFVLSASGTAYAQEQPTVARGKELFGQYCVRCHGFAGKGDGPDAPTLKTKPADLTLISKTHNGEFPRFVIMKFITGDTAVAAHGTREMPIWGEIFRKQEGTTGEWAKVLALTDYIESIQQ